MQYSFPMGFVRVLQRGFDVYDRRSRARFEPAWEDSALTAALREVKRGRITVAVELVAASTDPALRTFRSQVLGKAIEPRLEELGDPDDPYALLLLGIARVDRAWRLRGGGYARYTGADQFQGFFGELAKAGPVLRRVTELLPDDPSPWSKLQWHGIGSQAPRAELDRIWEELRRRDPTSFSGAFGRVQAISEKWHGRPGEAAVFAEEFLASLKPGAPVAAVVAAAHMEIVWRRMDDDAGATTAEGIRAYFRDPSVSGLMRRASDLWAEGAGPHPQDREAHHLLGGAHYFAGDVDRARFHLFRAGPSLPQTLPWDVPALFAAPYYTKVRRELNL